MMGNGSSSIVDLIERGKQTEQKEKGWEITSSLYPGKASTRQTSQSPGDEKNPQIPKQ
jgi:hypothetical protein